MALPALMVILGDRSWTLQAMHLACAMARDSGGMVYAVKMVRVNNPVLLGDSAGYVNYSTQDRHALQDCEHTAQAYAIPFRPHVCIYANYAAGLATAAEQLDAAVLFVPPSLGRLVLWNRYQRWRLHHIIGRPIYGLATPDDQPVLVLGTSGVTTEPDDGGLSPLIRPTNS